MTRPNVPPRPVQLIGGWGYNNLGDEAILAGYIEHYGKERVRVASVDPARTRRAQISGLEVRSEARVRVRERAGLSVVCGGGYLNGNWKREVGPKLQRINRIRGRDATLIHGVEVRRLYSSPFRHAAESLFRGTAAAVRDEQSAAEVEALGAARPAVLPDSISLLYPALDKYFEPIDELAGKVVLNLLDIGGRADSHEAELDVNRWRLFTRELIDRLGDRAVGLVIGGGDYRFMKAMGAINLVEPRTVGDLVSVLGSAAGVISVRMHPALLASALGTPVASIPYCGKVRPTLSRIGVESIIDGSLDTDAMLHSLRTGPDPTRWQDEWNRAHALNRDWLERSEASAESHDETSLIGRG